MMSAKQTTYKIVAVKLGDRRGNELNDNERESIIEALDLINTKKIKLLHDVKLIHDKAGIPEFIDEMNNNWQTVEAKRNRFVQILSDRYDGNLMIVLRAYVHAISVCLNTATRRLIETKALSEQEITEFGTQHSKFSNALIQQILNIQQVISPQEKYCSPEIDNQFIQAELSKIAVYLSQTKPLKTLSLSYAHEKENKEPVEWVKKFDELLLPITNYLKVKYDYNSSQLSDPLYQWIKTTFNSDNPIGIVVDANYVMKLNAEQSVSGDEIKRIMSLRKASVFYLKKGPFSQFEIVKPLLSPNAQYVYEQCTTDSIYLDLHKESFSEGLIRLVKDLFQIRESKSNSPFLSQRISDESSTTKSMIKDIHHSDTIFSSDSESLATEKTSGESSCVPVSPLPVFLRPSQSRFPHLNPVTSFLSERALNLIEVPSFSARDKILSAFVYSQILSGIKNTIFESLKSDKSISEKPIEAAIRDVLPFQTDDDLVLLEALANTFKLPITLIENTDGKGWTYRLFKHQSSLKISSINYKDVTTLPSIRYQNLKWNISNFKKDSSGKQWSQMNLKFVDKTVTPRKNREITIKKTSQLDKYSIAGHLLQSPKDISVTYKHNPSPFEELTDVWPSSVILVKDGSALFSVFSSSWSSSTPDILGIFRQYSNHPATVAQIIDHLPIAISEDPEYLNRSVRSHHSPNQHPTEVPINIYIGSKVDCNWAIRYTQFLSNTESTFFSFKSDNLFTDQAKTSISPDFYDTDPCEPGPKGIRLIFSTLEFIVKLLTEPSPPFEQLKEVSTKPNVFFVVRLPDSFIPHNLEMLQNVQIVSSFGADAASGIQRIIRIAHVNIPLESKTHDAIGGVSPPKPSKSPQATVETVQPPATCEMNEWPSSKKDLELLLRDSNGGLANNARKKDDFERSFIHHCILKIPDIDLNLIHSIVEKTAMYAPQSFASRDALGYAPIHLAIICGRSDWIIPIKEKVTGCLQHLDNFKRTPEDIAEYNSRIDMQLFKGLTHESAGSKRRRSASITEDITYVRDRLVHRKSKSIGIENSDGTPSFGLQSIWYAIENYANISDFKFILDHAKVNTTESQQLVKAARYFGCDEIVSALQNRFERIHMVAEDDLNPTIDSQFEKAAEAYASGNDETAFKLLVPFLNMSYSEYIESHAVQLGYYIAFKIISRYCQSRWENQPEWIQKEKENPVVDVFCDLAKGLSDCRLTDTRIIAHRSFCKSNLLLQTSVESELIHGMALYTDQQFARSYLKNREMHEKTEGKHARVTQNYLYQRLLRICRKPDRTETYIKDVLTLLTTEINKLGNSTPTLATKIIESRYRLLRGLVYSALATETPQADSPPADSCPSSTIALNHALSRFGEIFCQIQTFNKEEYLNKCKDILIEYNTQLLHHTQSILLDFRHTLHSYREIIINNMGQTNDTLRGFSIADFRRAIELATDQPDFETINFSPDDSFVFDDGIKGLTQILGPIEISFRVVSYKLLAKVAPTPENFNTFFKLVSKGTFIDQMLYMFALKEASSANPDFLNDTQIPCLKPQYIRRRMQLTPDQHDLNDCIETVLNNPNTTHFYKDLQLKYKKLRQTSIRPQRSSEFENKIRTALKTNFRQLRYYATQANDSGILNFIDRYANENPKSENADTITDFPNSGYTELHDACKSGDINRFNNIKKRYIGHREQRHSFLFQKDHLGWTAAHYAAQNRHFNILDQLLELGGKNILNATDHFGRNPVYLIENTFPKPAPIERVNVTTETLETERPNNPYLKPICNFYSPSILGEFGFIDTIYNKNPIKFKSPKHPYYLIGGRGCGKRQIHSIISKSGRFHISWRISVSSRESALVGYRRLAEELGVNTLGISLKKLVDVVNDKIRDSGRSALIIFENLSQLSSDASDNWMEKAKQEYMPANSPIFHLFSGNIAPENLEPENLFNCTHLEVDVCTWLRSALGLEDNDLSVNNFSKIVSYNLWLLSRLKRLRTQDKTLWDELKSKTEGPQVRDYILSKVFASFGNDKESVLSFLIPLKYFKNTPIPQVIWETKAPSDILLDRMQAAGFIDFEENTISIFSDVTEYLNTLPSDSNLESQICDHLHTVFKGCFIKSHGYPSSTMSSLIFSHAFDFLLHCPRENLDLTQATRLIALLSQYAAKSRNAVLMTPIFSKYIPTQSNRSNNPDIDRLVLEQARMYLASGQLTMVPRTISNIAKSEDGHLFGIRSLLFSILHGFSANTLDSEEHVEKALKHLESEQDLFGDRGYAYLIKGITLLSYGILASSVENFKAAATIYEDIKLHNHPDYAIVKLYLAYANILFVRNPSFEKDLYSELTKCRVLIDEAIDIFGNLESLDHPYNAPLLMIEGLYLVEVGLLENDPTKVNKGISKLKDAFIEYCDAYHSPYTSNEQDVCEVFEKRIPTPNIFMVRALIELIYCIIKSRHSNINDILDYQSNSDPGKLLEKCQHLHASINPLGTSLLSSHLECLKAGLTPENSINDIKKTYQNCAEGAIKLLNISQEIDVNFIYSYYIPIQFENEEVKHENPNKSEV